MSALKKSEEGDSLIIRVYNITSDPQNTRLTFYEKIMIKNAEIVNFLEEKPQYEIKAKIINYKRNVIEILLEAHVIATYKIECDLLE